MSQPFVGEIRAFGFNFCPEGWLPCQGQIVEIADYTALYSLLYTRFGGDGRVTFGLPDFRGRIPMGYGGGPGLTYWNIGNMPGYEQVTLNENQMPTHSHAAQTETEVSTTVYAETATGDDPTGKYFGKPGINIFIDNGRTPQKMADDSITTTSQSELGTTGSDQSHYNIQPSLVANYCICYDGLYPQRP